MPRVDGFQVLAEMKADPRHGVRDVAGNERCREEQKSNGGEDNGIGGTDVEQQRGHDAG